MKNLKIESKKKEIFYEKSNLKIKTYYILFVLLLWSTYYSGQNLKQKNIQSIGLDCYSTGNGLGTFYSPYIGLTKGNNAFNIGPVIQKRSDLLRGVKLGYSRTLTLSELIPHRTETKDFLQLNFFTSLQYTNMLPLSYSTIKHETLIFGYSKPNIEKIRLNTGEINIGFEFYVNIINKISWKNYIAGSVYYHFNYSTIIDCQKCAPTLNLGTGLCFDIQ